ncbi:hypothetical protein KEJ15_05100 [Candidatus Bathyarchaeota archaeon]|nr:hypothetical protein [Candidatus Bathyarchaeota archaeon]
MAKTFMMRLDRLQPSQLFISSAKLAEVMKTFDPDNVASMEPIPIKKLENDIVFVDGHTRAFAAFLHGLSAVPVYWENEELDWDAYLVCVGWCKSEGIRTIADLKNRVISQEEYEILWYRRCEEMQQDLEAKRRQMQAKEKSKASGGRICLEY